MSSTSSSTTNASHPWSTHFPWRSWVNVHKTPILKHQFASDLSVGFILMVHHGFKLWFAIEIITFHQTLVHQIIFNSSRSHDSS